MSAPGPPPHIIHGVNGPMTNLACWLFAALATVTLAARLVSRIHLTKFFGIDDVFIVIAYLFLLAMTILTSVDIATGAGRHFNTLTPHEKMETTKWVLIIQCVSAWTLAMPKLSVVALLVRVFEPRRWVSILFYCMAVFGVIVAAVTTVIWGVQCQPIQKLYDPSVEGTCWPRDVAYKFAKFQFSLSIVYDFIFAVYPITVLMKLQMSLSRKLGVCANMALGILAGVVGIVKLARFPAVSKDNAYDSSFVETQVTIEVEIEASLLIIAACIPTSGPVITKIKSFVVGSVHGSSTKSATQPIHHNSFSARQKRRAADDLDFDDGIPMTAYAAHPSDGKNISQVYAHERNGRGARSGTGLRSPGKSIASSTFSDPP